MLPQQSQQKNRRFIGSWELGKTIGHGVTAKVKIATNINTGEKAALKIMFMDKISSSQVKVCKSEVNILQKLTTHDNIITLKEAWFDVDYPRKLGKFPPTKKAMIVLLELAPNGELFDFLSLTGPFDERLARSYFHQLVEGVEYCHNAGVAHRDLKPENILFDAQFRLKLADFGFGRFFNSANNMNPSPFAGHVGDFDLMRTECGTKSYMAPEIFQRTSSAKGYHGTAVDIFSMGVILFIMLSGFPPFRNASRADWWFGKLMNNQHALFWQAHMRTAYFSDDGRDLLNKLLDPNPSSRITLGMIKEHSWYNGPVYTQQELELELSSRHSEILAQKSLEPISSSRISAGVSRGSNETPMDEKTYCAQATLDNEPYQTLEYNEKAVGFHNYTTFKTPVNHKFLYDVIKDSIEDFLPTAVIKLKDNYKIKVVNNTTELNVGITIQIYTSANSNECCYVEFLRDFGDILDFHYIYDLLHSNITGIREEVKMHILNDGSKIQIDEKN